MHGLPTVQGTLLQYLGTLWPSIAAPRLRKPGSRAIERVNLPPEAMGPCTSDGAWYCCVGAIALHEMELVVSAQEMTWLLAAFASFGALRSSIIFSVMVPFARASKCKCELVPFRVSVWGGSQQHQCDLVAIKMDTINRFPLVRSNVHATGAQSFGISDFLEMSEDYFCPGCSAHQLLIYRDPGHLARAEAAGTSENSQDVNTTPMKPKEKFRIKESSRKDFEWSRQLWKNEIWWNMWHFQFWIHWTEVVMDVLGEGDWIEAGRENGNILKHVENLSRLPWGRRCRTWDWRHRSFWWCNSPWETWFSRLNRWWKIEWIEFHSQEVIEFLIAWCLMLYWGNLHLNRTWVASCSGLWPQFCHKGRNCRLLSGIKHDETLWNAENTPQIIWHECCYDMLMENVEAEFWIFVQRSAERKAMDHGSKSRRQNDIDCHFVGYCAAGIEKDLKGYEGLVRRLAGFSHDFLLWKNDCQTLTLSFLCCWLASQWGKDLHSAASVLVVKRRCVDKFNANLFCFCWLMSWTSLKNQTWWHDTHSYTTSIPHESRTFEHEPLASSKQGVGNVQPVASTRVQFSVAETRAALLAGGRSFKVTFPEAMRK